MSGDLSAALWSIVGGTVGGTVGGFIVLLISRSLRHRGKILCDFDDWSFRYVLKMADEFEDLHPVRIDPAEERLGENDVVDRARYGFTAHLFNGKDVRVALRDARVVFLSEGQEKLADRPLPVENRELTGGMIQLGPKESATFKIRSTIRGNQLAGLTSGWDEVRLLATREDGTTPFDERIAAVPTSLRKP